VKGTIITDHIGERELAIYLPPSYPDGAASFPVVYVHDGGDLFAEQADSSLRPAASLQEIERKFASGELAELIMVGIAPVDRIHEYTPWFAKALSERFADFGGRGAEYLAFIVEQVKPHIDSRYKTNRRPDQTGIIGKSLGGLISLYAAYLYPGVFGKIGSISGSFWYEGFADYMREQKMAQTGLRLYLDVGSLEGEGKQTVQREMVARTKEAYAILAASGLNGKQLRLHVEEGGRHELSCFRSRFPQALSWLFQK
jgi:predicted alpha/beta superfamily hydrolase